MPDSESGSLHRVSHFDIYSLGVAHDVNMGGAHRSSTNIQLLNKVEESQLEGKIRLIAREEDLVTVSVSKHGIKVTSHYCDNSKELVERFPLREVSQVVHYMDGFNKPQIAIKIGQADRTVYDVYVYQCKSEEQAQNLCKSVRGVFELVAHRAV